MTEGFIQELIKQGGFAVLCGAMFLVYRHDAKQWAAKQTESAQAFMSFGERTATALTQVSETMRRQGEILSRIEQHLSDNHLCPVTQITTEMLRQAGEPDAPQRRRVDALMRDALKRAASDAPPREGL